MAELIKTTDSLNDGRLKLNAAITDSETALKTANTAKETAELAKAESENTQTQLDTIVIEGDSSVEAAQARVNNSGTAFPTLKQRLDAEHAQVTAQLQHLTNWVNVEREYNAQVGQDVTSKINQAITDLSGKRGTLYFPGGVSPYLIDPSIGIQLKSNITLEFDQSCVFKSLPTSLSGYDLFDLVDVENVKIGKCTIIGDRYEHTGTSGEWGNGIGIRGSRNIILENIEIRECWGDGIYIGVSDVNDKCENVIINNPILIANRRQGISIISVDGLTINNPTILNTKGAPPQSGIDIEPNAIANTLKNIVINQLKTKGNDGAGFEINLTSYRNSANEIDIVLNGHTSDEDTDGILIRNGGLIKGQITILDPVIKRARFKSIAIDNYSYLNPNIKIIRPVIYNTSTRPKETVSPIDDAGIRVYRSANDPNTWTEPIGNVTIIEPTIIDDRDNKKTGSAIYVRDLKNSKVSNVVIMNPMRLDAYNDVKLAYVNAENSTIIDGMGLLTKNIDANESLTMINYAKKIVFNGETSTSTATLQSVPVGYELEFVNISNTRTLIVRTLNVLGVNDGVSNELYLRGKGTKIKVRKINYDENTWEVINIFGDVKGN